jgi:uncharacterized protein (DUF58 family)
MAFIDASFERFRPGQWFDGWILERVRERRGTVVVPFHLEYRHIYVMPTRFGAWFGALLGLTVVGGLNFNNNMALLFGFTLAAIAQLTSFLAYRNLVGLTLNSIQAEPVFAGEAANFRLFINNPEPRHRYTVQLCCAESADTLDIEPNRSGCMVLQQQTGVRGWMQMQPCNLESRIPLGLFRAWSVIIPFTRCLVYPQPASNPPPLPRTGRGDDGLAKAGEGDQFHGLREYRPGDPLRSVAWRTSARHDKLYSQVMETPREEACELNWYLMGALHPEEKLSILTAWVLRAERRQIPYSLELPTDALPAALGKEHRDACLKILALYGT